MEKTRFLKLVLIAAVTIAIWNIPAPAGLEVETWHIVALYLGLLLGLVIKPFSEPIITLIIVGIAAMFMDTSILLKGYGNNMAWFIAMVTIVYSTIMSWKDIYVGLTPVWLMNGIALTFGVGFVMMIGFAVTGFVFFNRRKRR